MRLPVGNPRANIAKMSKRLGVLLMFALSGAFAVVWGLVLARSARGVILDYRVMDLGARCLLQHRDLYKESDMLRVYAAEVGDVSILQSGHDRFLAAIQVYPPPAELVFAPFALFAWPISYCLWIATTLALLLLATLLMWEAACLYSPDLPFYFGCIVLANSGILLSGGNPAGIAVSLCVIAFWCFHQQRFQWAGAACLAISLAIKPHDGGLVWLYVLILGGFFRRQALRSLVLCAALSAGAIAWVSQISPNWFQELRANLRTISSAGFYNDPGAGNAALMINLQTVIAAFRNQSHFYNPIAYLICAPLLLLWIYVTVRIRHSSKGIWLGVAAIAALSLLPVYHRPYDAKILLLTLPACAALWAEGGSVAWAGLAVTSAGILVTSDLPVAMLSMVNPQSYLQPGISNSVLLVLTTRPAPLVLLAMSSFYLWAYVRFYQRERTASISLLNSLTSSDQTETPADSAQS